jgi:hypothetical protein
VRSLTIAKRKSRGSFARSGALDDVEADATAFGTGPRGFAGVGWHESSSQQKLGNSARRIVVVG